VDSRIGCRCWFDFDWRHCNASQ